MYCAECGTLNNDNNFKCTNCGQILHPSPQAPPVKTDDISGLIPYKNASALVAYYLGVFSLIPFFPLGIAAFGLGLYGLRAAKKHPEAKGKAHAWVGILVGGFFGLLYLIGTIGAIVGLFIGPT